MKSIICSIFLCFYVFMDKTYKSIFIYFSFHTSRAQHHCYWRRATVGRQSVYVIDISLVNIISITVYLINLTYTKRIFLLALLLVNSRCEFSSKLITVQRNSEWEWLMDCRENGECIFVETFSNFFESNFPKRICRHSSRIGGRGEVGR